MDWIKNQDRYTAKISVSGLNGMNKAVDALAWAVQQFGEPYGDKNYNASWTVDAVDGQFIFHFKNTEDCTLFILTCC